MIADDAAFRLNDLICRRYPGAFKGPTDSSLQRLPWPIKEAVWVLEMQDELAARGISLTPPQTAMKDTLSYAAWVRRVAASNG